MPREPSQGAARRQPDFRTRPGTPSEHDCSGNSSGIFLQMNDRAAGCPGCCVARRRACLDPGGRAAAARLGLAQKDLAAVLGVSASTVSRFAQRPLDPRSKEGELAVLFVRLYRSLDAMVGGQDEAARAWMHADNHHLGGVRPPASP